MSHNTFVFSPQQWAVMQALSTYRYLTVEQMLQLGISKNAKSIRDKTLFALRHRKFIQSTKIGSFLPDVHTLTSLGADELAGREKINAPQTAATKRHSFSALFAPHRFAQVDFHIGFRKWISERGDADILLELQDFQGRTSASSGKLQNATALNIPGLSRSVIPDGTFVVELISGQQAIYLSEIHRSTQTKAVTEQLLRYLPVIRSGAVQAKYGYEVNPMICSVHMQDSVLLGVKKRLLQHPDFEPFKRNFVFRRMDGLISDFRLGWHLADDTPAIPFPLSNPSSDVR
ncbi:MAG: hypothetical protein AAF292_11010 [Pseudomonadota bacterium]